MAEISRFSYLLTSFFLQVFSTIYFASIFDKFFSPEKFLHQKTPRTIKAIYQENSHYSKSVQELFSKINNIEI